MDNEKDPLLERFDEAYLLERTAELVIENETYRIEIVGDVKTQGAGSRYKARYWRQRQARLSLTEAQAAGAEEAEEGYIWVTES